jgi:N utilization substance protein A
MAEALQERARSALLAQAMTSTSEPDESLLNLPSMTRTLAYRLAEKNITTSELLAEYAVDELVEMIGLDESLAGALIIEARKPWFEDEDKKDQ